MALVKSLLNFIEKHYLPSLERMLAAEPLQPQLLNFTQVKRILVIIPSDGYTDFLMATPVLRALRQSFPGALLGVLVHERIAPLTEKNEFIDSIMIYEPALSVGTFLKLRRQLRHKWDLVIVLTTREHDFALDVLAYLTRARFILGSEHKVFPGCTRNFFYNLIAPYWEGDRHRVLRLLDVVHHIGIGTDDLSECIMLTSNEVLDAREILENRGLHDDGPVIGVHPGAGRTLKRWPVANFAEVLKRLQQQYHARGVLFWGENEAPLKDQFCSFLERSPILIEPVSPRKLAAFLAQCDLVLCNDSDIMHLAAAVNTPLIAIFGPTDPGEWKPPGYRFIALRGDGNNTATVSPDEVFEAARAQLAESGRHAREETWRALVDEFVASVDISESVLQKYREVLNGVEETLNPVTDSP